MSGPALNDFVIKIGTVNGTGSASANGLLMKAIFRMGIPVVGKNVFPSNIQGLPTWYEIRVNEEGFAGRSGDVHIMVAMNQETYEKDLASVSPGGVLIYDSTWPRPHFMTRDDVTVLGVPFARMVNAEFDKARTRILLRNMAYVGAVAALVDIDMKVITQLVTETFSAKPKLIDANLDAVKMGYDHVRDNLKFELPFKTERRDLTSGKIMIDGNTAAALGCVYGGATFGAWYPITPSTSLMDGFAKYCAKLRVDKDTGKNNYYIIQAEDELAAAGLIIGAAWNGARAFTPTSGAGISLMQEFIGFAYYSEVPTTFFDVQRVGPSTGMPTRTQQCDTMTCAYASHGDTKHICLYPANPAECFETAPAAMDLAERFQTPVFVLSDLDIGMNDWMIDELTWDEFYQPDRGKVLTAEQLETMPREFYRYQDVDGDHIPYRTLPATHPTKGAYFNRGSGHNQYGRYTEDSEEYKQVVDRLKMKWASAADFVPQPIVTKAASPAAYGLIAYGSSDGAVHEACVRMARQGIHFDYMRLRAFPFPHSVEEFILAHDRTFVIEQNRDAQMMNMLLMETMVPREKLSSITYYAGEPLSYKFIMNALGSHQAAKKIA